MRPAARKLHDGTVEPVPVGRVALDGAFPAIDCRRSIARLERHVVEAESDLTARRSSPAASAKADLDPTSRGERDHAFAGLNVNPDLAVAHSASRFPETPYLDWSGSSKSSRAPAK
jgi:hypothetical protein